MRLCTAALLFLTPLSNALAADGPNVIALGDWSKPAVGKDGYALRGRLVLCEKVVSEDRREVAVYIELQDASESVHPDLQLWCEVAKTDFRPEYKNGLHCEMTDAKGNKIESKGFPFGGGVPLNQWVSLPTDATIRLRTTPFGIHQPGALAVCPDLGGMWIIPDDDKTEYRLSGTFTIDPAADNKPPEGELHVWRGTITFPPMQIFSRGAAARAQ
jgi:hypothetical protein